MIAAFKRRYSSGSIQHGGVKKIIKSASNQKGFADMSAEQQIQAFYKSRRAYARKNVKPSVIKGLDRNAMTLS